MAMTTKSEAVREDELPSTLQRSDKKAQATFAKAHDAAEQTYADEPNTEERARRTAFSALKHTHEKVGDRWEPKDGGRRGPSDAQAAGGAGTDRETAGGVDANATKAHLLDLARRLDVPGRSSMTKDELVAALQRANDRETARARSGS
ncbi:ChaB protein [Quadrisphaera granulorum]|uniref:ChaB protein n=1 Tax=Quadrisphaera granulorum TaxID=317664 RepID=A0A316A900_9ACTN|nr:ChaB family protein [Quadrisphaera granulorum]PWJ54002.1 ChaB protein [Quadrisphaera granulorum]SZE96459.1 ChaB protein [Quadrisphaera granulorum]